MAENPLIEQIRWCLCGILVPGRRVGEGWEGCSKTYRFATSLRFETGIPEKVMIHVMFRCHIGLNLNVVRQLMVDEEVVIECMK